MTYRTVIAGIGFTSDTPLTESDETEFCDLELTAEWVPPETELDAPRITGPGDLSGWVDVGSRSVWLPSLSNDLPIHPWQLRQMAPVVSAMFSRLVLHASASQVGAGVVAFVGESEAGKSTLAWEMLKAGHPLVADDLLPIRFDPHLQVPTSQGPLGLATICFLSRSGEELAIADIPKVEAFELLAVNGFGEHGDPEAWAFQFDSYHQIVGQVRHVSLVIPDDRARLPEVIDAIASTFGPSSSRAES